MPLKITSRWLELDPSAADALTASNIYYSDTETIAAKISENNVQTVLTNPNVDTSVQNGDFVYLGSDGKYYPAIADGTEKQNVVGMYNADNNVIVTTGVVDLSISANYGDWVYLSDTNAGKVQTTETTVNIGIALGNNKVLLASISSGSDDKGLPYKSKLTLSSTYTVPNDYGVVVPERFEVEEDGELVIEENGVFMIVDNEKPEKVYAFDSERLGNIPAEDYFNYEGATKYSTLNDAVEAVGSANKDLLIKGNVTVDSDLTIPENINLVFTRNGKITVNSGVTLTINGGIQAGLWQIFVGNGTITGNPKIEAVYPEWFGAKGDGVTDDTEAIQRAVDFSNTIHFCKIYSASGVIMNPTRVHLVFKGIGNSKIIGQGKEEPIIKILGSDTNQTREILFDNLTFDLNGNSEGVFVEGLYMINFSQTVEFLNSTYNSATGHTAIHIKNGFNYVINSRIYGMKSSSSGEKGEGILIESTSDGQYSGNITNIAIRDALIQGCYKQISFNLEKAADSILLENIGFSGDSNSYGVFIDGYLDDLTIKTVRFEGIGHAIYTTSASNTGDLDIDDIYFWNCPMCFSLNGNGQIIIKSIIAKGTTQDTKYKIFDVVNCNVLVVKRPYFYSTTYEDYIDHPPSGTGTFKFLERISRNYAVSSVELSKTIDNLVITNCNSSDIEFVLPDINEVPDGATVMFLASEYVKVTIKPYSGQRIYPKDVDEIYVHQNYQPGNFIELRANKRTGVSLEPAWYVISVRNFS